MLFGVRPGLDQCGVFDGLNRFLREALLAAFDEREMDPHAMPPGLCDAVTANPSTMSAVGKLMDAMAALKYGEKAVFKAALLEDLDPCDFLCDRGLHPTIVPDSIFSELKALSVHLYARTAKLAAVEAACGECIDDHYARFRHDDPPGNGNVCCVCGTEYLAQMQAGVDEGDQWRGPYDHLLAKDDYPLYGVDPRNLVPICQTCNSKAKLAKDLLVKDGNRRLSFSPWTEAASTLEVRVFIDDSDVSLRAVVDFVGADADRQEKLDTWDDVYRIRARVEGEFLALHEKMAEDVCAPNEAEFLQRLEQSAHAKAQGCRRTPFNYWRAKLYRAVTKMNSGNREALRLAIVSAMPRDNEMDDLFFND